MCFNVLHTIREANSKMRQNDAVLNFYLGNYNDQIMPVEAGSE